MSNPFTITHINERTGESVEDARRLAAGHCLAILYAAAAALSSIEQHASSGLQREKDVEDAMTALAFTMFANGLGSGARLIADIHTLAEMLGCRLVPVAAAGKAVN